MTPSLARLLPPKRGAVAQPISMELVRELTEDDLAELPYSKPLGVNPIKRAREIHHRQAQLVADGRKAIEIAAIVGCTAERIAQLKTDPTFQYLVEYYADQNAEIAFETNRRVQGKLVDVLEMAVDEIQSRLENDPNRLMMETSELRKIAEFAADRTIAPPRATQQGSAVPPTRIELNFGWPARESTGDSSATIDITPQKEISDG